MPSVGGGFPAFAAESFAVTFFEFCFVEREENLGLVRHPHHAGIVVAAEDVRSGAAWYRVRRQ